MALRLGPMRFPRGRTMQLPPNLLQLPKQLSEHSVALGIIAGWGLHCRVLRACGTRRTSIGRGAGIRSSRRGSSDRGCGLDAAPEGTHHGVAPRCQGSLQGSNMWLGGGDGGVGGTHGAQGQPLLRKVEGDGIGVHRHASQGSLRCRAPHTTHASTVRETPHISISLRHYTPTHRQTPTQNTRPHTVHTPTHPCTMHVPSPPHTHTRSRPPSPTTPTHSGSL